jgi:hypothetical protein
VLKLGRIIGTESKLALQLHGEYLRY